MSAERYWRSSPRQIHGTSQAQTEAELSAIRRSVKRGQPYGGERWVQATAERLGLQSTLRERGRPAKRESALRRRN